MIEHLVAARRAAAERGRRIRHPVRSSAEGQRLRSRNSCQQRSAAATWRSRGVLGPCGVDLQEGQTSPITVPVKFTEQRWAPWVRVPDVGRHALTVRVPPGTSKWTPGWVHHHAEQGETAHVALIVTIQFVVPRSSKLFHPDPRWRSSSSRRASSDRSRPARAHGEGHHRHGPPPTATRDAAARRLQAERTDSWLAWRRRLVRPMPGPALDGRGAAGLRHLDRCQLAGSVPRTLRFLRRLAPGDAGPHPVGGAAIPRATWRCCARYSGCLRKGRQPRRHQEDPQARHRGAPATP